MIGTSDRAASGRVRRMVVWLVVALGFWSAIVAARAALNVTHGLTGQYFANAQWSGAPAFSTVDAEISMA